MLENVHVVDALAGIDEMVSLGSMETATYPAMVEAEEEGTLTNTATAYHDYVGTMTAIETVEIEEENGGGGSSGGGSGDPGANRYTGTDEEEEPETSVEPEPSPIVTPPVEMFEVEEPEVPLATPVITVEEPMPMLPQTGETLPIQYYAMGFVLMGLGVYLKRRFADE